MLENSILGKVYEIWQLSFFYSVAARICGFFSSAWKGSALVGAFTREGRLCRAFLTCPVGRLFHAIYEFVFRIIRAVTGFIKPAWDGSAIISLARGSVFLKFEFLLGAFVCLMFMVPHDYWSNGLAFLGAAGLFAIYTVLAANGKRKAVYPEQLGLPLILFILSCFTSLFFSADRGDSVRVLVFYATAVLLLWIISADLDTPERLRGFLGWIYAAVMFTALVAAAQRVAGVEVSASFTDIRLNAGVPGRVFSTLDNPNNYAEFLVLFTPLCAAYAMTEKNMLRRLMESCLVALPMLALVMTYSRSCWLSIVVTAVIFVYYADRKLVPLGFLAAVFLVPFLPRSMLVRIGTIFNSADTSASHRLDMWPCIVNMLRDSHRWLTGIGMGPNTFAQIFPAYAEGSAKAGVYHSQMLYLELFVEWGVLGFVSFMWLMMKSLKDAAKKLYSGAGRVSGPALIACVSAFAGIAVACVFEYIWFYPRVLFAFFIVLGVMRAAMDLKEA